MVVVDNPNPLTRTSSCAATPPTGAERQTPLPHGTFDRRAEAVCHGSGRLELARAIASKENPLTARVMANRIWLHHFGQGLVRTPSDFGVRADMPTHPELLDYLAARFMESGWSMKQLHRLILTSRTWQQSAQVSEALQKRDPENRLLAHQNRRRLDFESLRDSMLAVGGNIDLSNGGRAVDLFKEPFQPRRTIYGYIDRQNLPGVFRSFDFASPDTHSPQRYQTTVPQQALFLMNSPFVLQQAHAVAVLPEVAAADSPSEKVSRIYRRILQRPPTPRENELLTEFLQGPPPTMIKTATPTPRGRTASAISMRRRCGRRSSRNSLIGRARSGRGACSIPIATSATPV